MRSVAGIVAVGPCGPHVNHRGRAWGEMLDPPGGTNGANPQTTNGPASLLPLGKATGAGHVVQMEFVQFPRVGASDPPDQAS